MYLFCREILTSLVVKFVFQILILRCILLLFGAIIVKLREMRFMLVLSPK